MFALSLILSWLCCFDLECYGQGGWGARLALLVVPHLTSCVSSSSYLRCVHRHDNIVFQQGGVLEIPYDELDAKLQYDAPSLRHACPAGANITSSDSL